MDDYTTTDYRTDREFAQRAAIAITSGLDEMVEVLQMKYKRLRTGAGDDFTPIDTISGYNPKQIFAVLRDHKNMAEERMAKFRNRVYAPLDSDLDQIVEAYKFASEDGNQKKKDSYGLEARARLQQTKTNQAKAEAMKRHLGVLAYNELVDYGQQKLELQKA